MSKKKSVSIGGQAVLEGVMMRGETSIATAVRDTSGKVQLETQRVKAVKEKSKWFKLPVIRGVVNFGSSMVVGMKILTRTSEVFGIIDEEPSKFEKWLSKKLKIELTDIAIMIGIVLGIALAIGLFVLFPQFITEGFLRVANLESINSIVKNLLVGVIRLLIFIAYIVLVSRIKDIKRLFAYHGAEHKVIACFESEMELNVENVRKNSRIHDRCGTTFLFLVMFISIIFFSFFGWPTLWLRILSRIILIPVVAGISYEILKFTAKYDNLFVNIIKAPGKWLQKLTTNEPDDEMIEVAITAFNEVLELDKDFSRPLKTFVTLSIIEKVKEDIRKILKDENEIELILMHVLGYNKKSELKEAKRIGSDKASKAIEMAKRRKNGEPLQHILSSACFWGYEIKVDKTVLIPRMDTEILVDAALDVIKNLSAEKEEISVLDLCTGSGAVAIATKNELSKYLDEKAYKTKIIVDATDISQDALLLAKENAIFNNADITFYSGDLFEPLSAKVYDVIIANPPYISSMDIENLDAEVKDYEPKIALDGGEDGLDYYRRIRAEVSTFLTDKGYLFLEVGKGQSEEVKKMYEDEFDVEIIKDLSGINRVVKARLKKVI